MKVINIKDTKKQLLYKPLFTGEVVRQSPVTDSEGSDVSIDYVHFSTFQLQDLIQRLRK